MSRNHKSKIWGITKDISKETGAPMDLVHPIIQEFVERCTDLILSGNDFILPGVGKFVWKEKPPIKYHDVTEGAVKELPSRTKLTFRLTAKTRKLTMDKYGVELDDDKTKTADGHDMNKCPVCHAPLDNAGLCPLHGSAPFEKTEEEE